MEGYSLVDIYWFRIVTTGIHVHSQSFATY